MTRERPVVFLIGGGQPLSLALCQTFSRNKYQIIIADEQLDTAQALAGHYSGLAVALDPLSPIMWTNAYAAATEFYAIPQVVCISPGHTATSIDDRIMALQYCQESLLALESQSPIQVLVFLSHLAWTSDPSSGFDSASEHAIRAWVQAQRCEKIRYKLVGINVPPQKKPPSIAEIADAALWAAKRRSARPIFIPGGFGTRAFCQKACN